MAPIEWKDSFSVGVPAVDHEHRELIEMLARLQQELLSGAPAEEVEQALGELMRGISAHFALEEKFMRDKGYDQFAEHKADHEKLLDELRDLMEGERPDSSEALSQTLGDWFAVHFRTHDARLHSRLGDHPH